MSTRIGISPIARQNDDLPDLIVARRMERALKEGREIGYTAVAPSRRHAECSNTVPGAIAILVRNIPKLLTCKTMSCAPKLRDHTKWSADRAHVEDLRGGRKPQGALDLKAAADALAKMDYNGWIVVEAERDPAKTQPYGHSTLGLRPYRGSLRSVGPQDRRPRLTATERRRLRRWNTRSLSTSEHCNENVIPAHA